MIKAFNVRLFLTDRLDLDDSTTVTRILKPDNHYFHLLYVTAGIVLSILILHYAYYFFYKRITPIHPLDLTLLNFVTPNKSIWPSLSYSNFLVRGRPIPLHILLADLFLGNIVLRGSPSESLWQILRCSECTWSIALLAAWMRPPSDRPRLQNRVRLSPELRQAYLLKHSLLAQYLCLKDGEPGVAILGSSSFAQFLFKYYDIHNSHDDIATTRYSKVVLVTTYSVATYYITSALNTLTAGGYIMLELTIVQKRCPVAAWYAHFSRQLIDQTAISMLVNSCQSVQRFLCRRGVVVESVVDVSFEEAKICKATCENSRGARQIWNAWTAILLAEGVIKRFVFLGRKL
ncbi:hypothetical protein V1523DRAFT_407875 [Lipomyces doorenjongii]